MPNLLLMPRSIRQDTDNGKQLFKQGMQGQGYLVFHASEEGTDVGGLVELYRPEIIIFYPKYLWGGECFNPIRASFTNYQNLPKDILKVAVWHDVASIPEIQRAWHEELEPDLYLTWYHAKSVLPQADYIREDQLVRTYHLLDPDIVSTVSQREKTALISGFYKGCPSFYPLRKQISDWVLEGKLKGVDVLEHPGYWQQGTSSNEYLKTLSQYRVAICTASKYGFLLRKIIEATAAGCRVLTDLPPYDDAPGINGNLYGLRRDITTNELQARINHLAKHWDLGVQQRYSQAAKRQYNYEAECKRLVGLLNERVYANLNS